ncbi:MAG: tyrosine-type recombinase/integrase [Clostridia bacterium]|nr:tyrosine-type recombinase/integrase [Clostridia bacterium]
MFTNEIGGVINPDTISSWFKGFIKRYNLPNAHIHTLRHISATLLIAGGVDIAKVSKRLGHANKSTTLNIYTHAIKSADEAAAEMPENILNPSAHYKIG